MKYNKERTNSVVYRYLSLLTLFALLVMPVYVVADEPPSIPANIHGTVTVNGIPVTGAGYTVSGGGVQSGLDGSGEYLLTIPGGGSGYLSVLRYGSPLTVTNGYFSVTGGDDIWINLRALDIPITFNAASTSIMEGEFVTLSWSISNADYASIDKGVGSI
ncbi:MAG: hypothetical protein JXB09_02360, partial [Deltaproteobacteria bacterium]|nr:hypothetical protein [Deltaproteobacteria bacterium]